MEHKVRSLVSAIIVFLALLLPLRFPFLFWPILISSSLFSAGILFWVFDEKPNWVRIREDWFTVLFLFLFVSTAGIFTYLMPNQIMQALLLGGLGFGIYYIFLTASRLKRGYKPTLYLRNIMSLVAILGVFIATSDVLRWATISNKSYTQIIVITFSFFATFVISEFLFETQGVNRSILYSLALAFGVSQIVWILGFWLVSYPQSIRITNLGVPLPAIVSSVFFYLFWGISHHRLEETLTLRILWEYIFISVMFLGILFFTTDWLPS